MEGIREKGKEFFQSDLVLNLLPHPSYRNIK